MPTKITISAGDVSLPAELNDSETARAIVEVLPIEGTANTWGDEIYFDIPVEFELEADARADVAVGELGYWPVGHAFCIFFGRTPMSRGDEIRPASAVNVFGQVEGDATIFTSVRDGTRIEIEKAKS